MRRNVLFLLVTFLLACSVAMTGCKKGTTGDPTVLDAARRALNNSELERCAPEQYAQARALFADAEQAVADRNWDEAERLAAEAERLAAEARRVAAANPDCQPPAPPEQEAPLAPVASHDFITVYFDFDSSELRGDSRRALEEHARVLRNSETMRIRVEGHASEEGTSEYNLALGNRRAKSVRDFLIRSGVSESRIETISYGEERPAGRLEENRRVEFNLR